jgi:hypothetical protein
MWVYVVGRRSENRVESCRVVSCRVEMRDGDSIRCLGAACLRPHGPRGRRTKDGGRRTGGVTSLRGPSQNQRAVPCQTNSSRRPVASHHGADACTRRDPRHSTTAVSL